MLLLKHNSLSSHGRLKLGVVLVKRGESRVQLALRINDCCGWEHGVGLQCRRCQLMEWLG